MSDEKVEVIFDDKEVVSFLKGMKTRLKKIADGEKRFVGLLSAIVYKDIIGHFQKEEGSSGPWQDWSDSYESFMQQIGRGNNQILQMTGKLRQNFKPSNVRSTNAGILWFNDAKTKGGFPYAAAHEEGGSQLPKRDFMWLSDDGAEDISKQTLQFMLDEGA